MGMFDYINGEQVKCFYVPLCYGINESNESSISHSGGTLKSYSIGDEVPWKTDYYKYKPNLIIIDTLFREKTYRCLNCGNEGNDSELKDGKLICDLCGEEMIHSPMIIHIIRNGKIYKTIYDIFNTMNQELFGSTEMVIDYHGNKLNIHSYQDMLDFIPDYIEYRKTIYECANKTMPLLNQIGKLMQNKNNPFFNKKELENLEFAYECERMECDKKIEEIENSYINKWHINDYEVEECFGEYYEVLYFQNNHKNSEFVQKNTQMIVNEFQNFLNHNSNAFALYKQYFEIDKETEQDILQLLNDYKIKLP